MNAPPGGTVILVKQLDPSLGCQLLSLFEFHNLSVNVD